MKILVVGAGAIGGYFGGRLLEKGQDVTFLVRPGRKEKLEKSGLKIKSVNGDVALRPKLITSEQKGEPFDVVILSTKSYQLSAAIKDVRPFVGDETMVLPLLNGVVHIEDLAVAFGDKAIIGGLCYIESTLDAEGTVIQASPMNQLVFGERSGEKSDRILDLQKAFNGTKGDFVLSDQIDQEMWQKYLFITAMSGITSMMESPIGPIRELESGKRTIAAFIKELANVMFGIGAPIKDTVVQDQIEKIHSMGAGMKSSMQRDMEKSHPTEVEHLQGYLLEKAKEIGVSVPILETIYTKLKLYEQNLHNGIQK
ncbi:ketopantoate reductase family protein [Planococcus sp. YIM B11945]|uniref:ketopantoate reductase family protein n=1 Tax=Planococcus sp. YIM B11945 TaxID=3435410 RepID=UPI003D7C77B9